MISGFTPDTISMWRMTVRVQNCSPRICDTDCTCCTMKFSPRFSIREFEPQALLPNHRPPKLPIPVHESQSFMDWDLEFVGIENLKRFPWTHSLDLDSDRIPADEIPCFLRSGDKIPAHAWSPESEQGWCTYVHVRRLDKRRLVFLQLLQRAVP